jgi:hypothetical protein
MRLSAETVEEFGLVVAEVQEELVKVVVFMEQVAVPGRLPS